MDEQENAVDHLLEIWKVLEVLTVSLDRMGMHEVLAEEKQEQSILDRFVGPLLFQRIAAARTFAYELLITCDPAISEKLERLSDDEDAVGYWQSSPPPS